MAAQERLDPKAPRGIGLANVARALSQAAELRKLSALFPEAGVEALYLPWLRLGERATPQSLDQQPASIDVLVPHASAAAAGEIAELNGWAPSARHRSRRMVTGSTRYTKDAAILDLYRSIRVARPVPRRLRHLEQSLWDGAAAGPSGLLEPRAEPLFVFRAMQALASRPATRNESQDGPNLPDRDGLDWSELQRIAGRSQLEGVLRPPAERRDPVRLVPESVHGRIRESLSMRRSGYGLAPWPRRGTLVRIDDLEIDVASGVFEPRLPITSYLVATCASLSEGLIRPLVVEVGTGSGAIALGYARLRPDARVVGLDISYRAVSCARKNRDRLGASSVRIAHSNLLDALPEGGVGTVDLVVANIPYVPPAWAGRTDWGAPVETAQGLDPDGLGLILRLARQATGFLRPGGVLILQLTGWQWETLAAKLKGIGYEPTEPHTRGDYRAAIGCAVWGGARKRSRPESSS